MIQPRTTGSSIVGTVFEGGVMIAGDTLGSYGSVRRFLDCQRVVKVNENIILGVSGDLADFQYVKAFIDDEIITDESYADGFTMKPRSLHCWLTRLLYQRRSEMDPLSNTYVIGGMQYDTPFLGYVDKLGTVFESSTIATEFGFRLALPILRDAYEQNGPMSIMEARRIMHECMKVLHSRDALSYYKYHLGIATSEGTVVEGPISLSLEWEFAAQSKN